ncbi:MAG: DUF4388 domain-containing protein [Myxococcales bacterium]|nr:DUF4388 domain-containing protein [Myxococcales bacterium]
MNAPLRVSYDTPEALRQQFNAEIALGGLFIPTVTNLGFRDNVRVVFDLSFCDDRVELDAEVVSVVEPELAGEGAEAGVAIQFTDSPLAVTAKLGPYIGESKQAERRRAPRRVARVPVLLETGNGERLTGRTRDLSQSGVLLSIDGPAIAVDEAVSVTIDHPTFEDERMTVSARVVRHLEVEGTVTALACLFEPAEGSEDAVLAFIDDVQSSEHARRLRGVTGAIGELGITNVIQVFGGCTRSGTLTVIRGLEEGRIIFEDGLLREVRLGPVSGMKALSRIVGWREGSFEFHSRVEQGFEPSEPVPLEGALLEATRQHDEIGRSQSIQWSDATRFELDRERIDEERSGLSKLEDSAIDLVAAGMTFRQILDVIPEADVDVHAALTALSDLGLIQPVG